MIQNEKSGISSAALHILAMGLMLCDHLWAMLFPAQEWLTCVGRMAFPIFAFMIAEGYFHTRNLRRYLLRIFIGAVLSEIPFDLMYGSSVFYPYHQNVLWTFFISLLLMAWIDKCKERFKPFPAACASAGLVLAGFIAGYAVMADYYGVGVLMTLTFYFFRNRSVNVNVHAEYAGQTCVRSRASDSCVTTWKNRVCQLVCMYILNVNLLGGYYYEVQVFGLELEVVQQGFALFALIPIWLYQGRKGINSKGFQYFCYAFYPAHMLILFLVREWMLRRF